MADGRVHVVRHMALLATAPGTTVLEPLGTVPDAPHLIAPLPPGRRVLGFAP